MGSINKSFSLLAIVLLAVSSLIMAKTACAQTVPEPSLPAQTIPKPSVPEFSLKYIDLSYDVAPTHGTDQYSGKTVITQDGYHVDNRSLQFTIKNQPFTPYTDTSGNKIGLYYNFRIKGAYGTAWDYYPFAPNGVTTSRYGGIFWGNSTESPADLAQSNSEYTTIAIEIPGVYRVPAEAQLDVQAQAIIGYMVPSDYMMAGHVYVFTGQYGDWSDTQTISIPDGKVTVSTSSNPSMTLTSSPSPTPIVPEFPSLAVLTFLSVSLVVAVAFAKRLGKTDLPLSPT
jgi:hypothetical protein